MKLLILFIIAKNVLSYNISDLYKLPKIYNMENYENCVNENNLFCELEFQLKSVKEETKLWKIIQNLEREESLFDRKILYRAMCLPKLYKNDEIKLKEIGLAKMRNELQSYDLDADLIYFHCKRSFTYDFKDYLILCFLCVYFGWIILATSLDYFTNNLTNKYFQYFSVIYNYKKMTSSFSKNQHYVKLKFLQGIRFYSLCIVISGHSLFTYISTYVENLEFFDIVFSYKVLIFFLYCLSFVVQVFFILSGWLSVLEIYVISENFSKLSMRQVLLLLINRLMRYLPIICFSLCATSNMFYSDNIPCRKIVDHYLNNCRTGWFLMLVQNWYDKSDSCNTHFWSLNVDIQAFLVLSLAFYLIIKYKLPLIRSLMMLCIFSILIQSIIMYYNNLKIFIKMIPRYVLPFTKKNPEFTLTYASTISNIPTYLIGSIFGILYLRNMNNNIFKTKILKLFWFITSVGLIIFASKLADISMSRLPRSLFGGSLKAIFATGFALFLLGLAQNVSVKLKHIFETRITEVLGKCTLSIYVFHMGALFPRIFNTYSPVKMVFYEMVLINAWDILKSILVGLVVYLVVEQPFTMIITRAFRKRHKEM